MPGIANDTDVGRDPLAGEGDSPEIVAAGQSEVAGRGPCRAPVGDEIALEPQAIVPPVIATPPDHRGGSIEAVSEQDHGLTRRQPAGDDREHLLLRGEADSARGFLDPPGQRQSALAPAHAQHQDLVAIGGRGLVEDQRDRLSSLGQLRQDLAGERFHNRIAAHQIIGQKPGNPLISHIPAIGFPRQPGGQFDQIGAAHMQHGRHQNRQLIPLRFALLWQPLRQLRFDAFRPNHDPVHLCHGVIPCQSELRIVASHLASTRQPIITRN